jgi:hypothetical protein
MARRPGRAHVSQLVQVRVPAPEGAPQVVLLDARAAGLDEAGLRAQARALAAERPASHVARSYRHPHALVAWHSEPVGVDIERIETCDTAFAQLICTPLERAGATATDDRDVYLSSLWCSKEALAKALGDALQYDPSRLDSPMRWPNLRSGRWNATPLQTVPGHVAWLCWRRAGGLSP